MLCIFAFKRVLYCIILTFVLLEFSHHQSSEPTFCIILINFLHSQGGGPSLPDHLLPRLLGLWTCPLLLINVQPTKWAFNVKTCQFYWGKGLAHYSQTSCQQTRSLLLKHALQNEKFNSVYFICKGNIPKKMETRSSWLNCASRDDEAVYWVSIGHYEGVAVGN